MVWIKIQFESLNPIKQLNDEILANYILIKQTNHYLKLSYLSFSINYPEPNYI